MKRSITMRLLPLLLLLLLACAGCARPDGLAKWAQSLKAEDVTEAYVWCSPSKEPERSGEVPLTQEQIEAVVAQINTITEDQLTWNQELAGITPEYGLRLICGEKEYNINHADAPDGSLETHWKNAQWWLENPALEEMLIERSGRPAGLAGICKRLTHGGRKNKTERGRKTRFRPRFSHFAKRG